MGELGDVDEELRGAAAEAGERELVVGFGEAGVEGDDAGAAA